MGGLLNGAVSTDVDGVLLSKPVLQLQSTRSSMINASTPLATSSTGRAAARAARPNAEEQLEASCGRTDLREHRPRGHQGQCCSEAKQVTTRCKGFGCIAAV